MNEKLPIGKTTAKLLLGSLRNCYEHVAYTFIMGFIWSLATLITAGSAIALSVLVHPAGGQKITEIGNIFPLMLMVLLGGVITAAFIWGPLNCGLIHLAYKIQDGTANIGELWQGIRRHYALASRVYALYCGGIIFLIVDIIVAFSFNNSVMKIAGISAMYFLIYLVLMGFYIPGLIAFQERNTVFKVLRKAYLLVLDNGLVNLFVGIAVAALTAIMAVLPVFYKPLGFLAPFCVIYFMMFGGFLNFLLSNLYHTVIARYDD